MRILIVGHGRMGQLVEAHASAHGCEVAGILDTPEAWPGTLPDADVAVEFSEPGAVRANVQRLADGRMNVVIGTTGWDRDREAVRALVEAAGIGVIVAANFSLGMHVFRRVVEQAARGFASLEDVGAWVHDVHHVAKKDAPSGTALVLRDALAGAGYARAIDMSSTRAGSVPGTHEVGFDGIAETVTLTHTVRDRAVFAHGALEAARWVRGRQGWFSIGDMVEG